MGKIKSAIEIALERTKSIDSDKDLIQADIYLKKGKKIISSFLDNQLESLDGCFKNLDKQQVIWIKEGMFQVLAANLVLPQNLLAANTLKRIKEGFLKIITNTKKLKILFEQLENFFEEYVDGKKHIKENLEAQYAHRLKEKEKALSRQLGTTIKLNPESDPEYRKLLNQTYSQFDEKYNSVLNKVKEELLLMFEEK